MRDFLKELKRRNVYKVAVAYLVAAFVVLQLAELGAGAFELPGWFEPMVWVLCGLGFPIALVLAWAFDLTPEGVRRTPSSEGDDRAAIQRLVAVGIGAVVVVSGWYLLGSGRGLDVEVRFEPEAREHSLAVLPLDPLSVDEESETFARGSTTIS